MVFTLFMSMIVGINDQSTDLDSVYKEQRRIRNKKAAKKSYETKKTERQTLQEKNTELVEAQKKLLHDKSRLQTSIMVLKHIVDNMEHTSITSTSTSKAETISQTNLAVCETDVSKNRNSVIPSASFYDNNEALDLSMNSQRSKSLTDVTVSAQTPITQVHNKCKKSAHLVDRTNIPHDEHKPSFLRCGAAQNANVPVCELKIKPEINGIKEDVDILIPLKKIKLEVL